jgi:hypothetical protein
MSPRTGQRGKNGQRLPAEAISLIERAIVLQGREKVARAAGIEDRTLRRALDGDACSQDTYQRTVAYAARVLVSLDWRAFRVTEEPQ